jgi:hypothetical protein
MEFGRKGAIVVALCKVIVGMDDVVYEMMIAILAAPA